jgi:hypothetical protein
MSVGQRVSLARLPQQQQRHPPRTAKVVAKQIMPIRRITIVACRIREELIRPKHPERPVHVAKGLATSTALRHHCLAILVA